MARIARVFDSTTLTVTAAATSMELREVAADGRLALPVLEGPRALPLLAVVPALVVAVLDALLVLELPLPN